MREQTEIERTVISIIDEQIPYGWHVIFRPAQDNCQLLVENDWGTNAVISMQGATLTIRSSWEKEPTRIELSAPGSLEQLEKKIQYCVQHE
jgi:hypothetical protein